MSKLVFKVANAATSVAYARRHGVARIVQTLAPGLQQRLGVGDELTELSQHPIAQFHVCSHLWAW
jgi:hypothetical protein